MFLTSQSWNDPRLELLVQKWRVPNHLLASVALPKQSIVKPYYLSLHAIILRFPLNSWLNAMCHSKCFIIIPRYVYPKIAHVRLLSTFHHGLNFKYYM